ncbi:MAG: SpoIIE family protein phosphatase, partial [Desulfarculaceae bacterium]|jgi:serine phosphatase RsbU (regulator of sigma subunit)
MPGMDGFGFLTKRLSHPDTLAIPVIVNSSLDDFESISRALAMEAYDYFTKPLNKNDLQVILPLKIRNAVQARRLLAETRRQNQVMRRELNLAARYQQFLLPQEASLPGLKVAYLFEPCSEVGGDYFDFIPLQDGRVALIIADVSGHGVAPAMTASIVKALLPGYLERSYSPALALGDLNRDLLRLTQADSFVTAFAALYSPHPPLLTWATAGHPPPIFLPSGGQAAKLTAKSVFLGTFENENPLVNFKDQQIEVSPGDRLALYTDGLTDTVGRKGQMYGLERLTKLLQENRDDDIDSLRGLIWEDLSQFRGDESPDDIAFILVEF